MAQMSDIELLDQVKQIAVAAGAEILTVYNCDTGVDVAFKLDDSPLTAADRQANQIIVAQLAALTPQIPILSEESEPAAFDTRQGWRRYWLVDPLDGTKEFIKRNGEFTVNIALIEDGVPLLGVVHVPVSATTYPGLLGEGAWKQVGVEAPLSIKVSPFNSAARRVRVVASRSHRDAKLDVLLAAFESIIGSVELVSMGSSLKICLLAEGEADIYPRLAPTSEWDTAAAHAVLSAAGGEIVDTSFNPLRYNQKSELLNPFFIGIADSSVPWQNYCARVLL
jgi:3'(2'), 5'-bisphosphate nucleotidase